MTLDLCSWRIITGILVGAFLGYGYAKLEVKAEAEKPRLTFAEPVIPKMVKTETVRVMPAD